MTDLEVNMIGLEVKATSLEIELKLPVTVDLRERATVTPATAFTGSYSYVRTLIIA